MSDLLDTISNECAVLYISTDQVYDGRTPPYTEKDGADSSLNVYGRSKRSFECSLLEKVGQECRSMHIVGAHLRATNDKMIKLTVLPAASVGANNAFRLFLLQAKSQSKDLPPHIIFRCSNMVGPMAPIEEVTMWLFSGNAPNVCVSFLEPELPSLSRVHLGFGTGRFTQRKGFEIFAMAGPIPFL